MVQYSAEFLTNLSTRMIALVISCMHIQVSGVTCWLCHVEGFLRAYIFYLFLKVSHFTYYQFLAHLEFGDGDALEGDSNCHVFNHFENVLAARTGINFSGILTLAAFQ